MSKLIVEQPSPCTYKVMLDDKDLSRLVTNMSIRIAAGRKADVTLTLVNLDIEFPDGLEMETLLISKKDEKR